MGGESETQMGETKRAGIAMGWIGEKIQGLWGNKLALVLLVYLLGNGTGTAISKIMGIGKPEAQAAEVDSTAIMVKEMRPVVLDLKPVPKMVRELYIAFGKIPGGSKALDAAQFEEFKRQQKEERQRLNLPRAAAPSVTQVEEEAPANYVTRRQSQRSTQ
mgnify:CR=1 FL=1